MESSPILARPECTLWRWFDPSAVCEGDALHMERDAQLLEAVGQGNMPSTIRCYTWSKPALTIGRHQSLEAAQDEFPGLPIYRRPTGGKAVLHGDDLTVIVIAAHRDFDPERKERGVLGAYGLLIAPMRAALHEFGVSTTLGMSDICAKPSTITSEDCFAYADRCDVIDAKHGIKIVGSAMRRTHEAVLLQMSLRPTDNIHFNDDAFLQTLRDHYTRYLNIGRWDFAAS